METKMLGGSCNDDSERNPFMFAPPETAIGLPIDPPDKKEGMG
ncbi:hypothetical protein [Paenibacillus sp. XY044]|nr:hypothetical protein [Paenibacillus sp. XY044]